MNPQTKVKIAFYWNASCGGCEEAIVDLGEDLFKVLEVVDIVFWPVALDFKLEDVEKLPDGGIDVAIINGGIRFSEHEKVVKLLRRKSKIVVAYGSCAHLGGIPGLANLWSKATIMDYVYLRAPSVVNESNVLPKEVVQTDVGELELPAFLDVLKPLNRVIDVDYYVPGCPPTPNVTLKAIETLLSGKLPQKGAVLGADVRAVCDTCPLNETKPEKLAIKEFRRPHAFIPDPKKCLLAQGLLCLGPVTRGGCEASCVKANMPCTGCFGPLDNVIDFGARALSFIASIIDQKDEEGIRKALGPVVDLVGQVYKFSLPSGLLKDLIKRKEV